MSLVREEEISRYNLEEEKGMNYDACFKIPDWAKKPNCPIFILPPPPPE